MLELSSRYFFIHDAYTRGIMFITYMTYIYICHILYTRYHSYIVAHILTVSRMRPCVEKVLVVALLLLSQ
jgi:hypothetical protein